MRGYEKTAGVEEVQDKLLVRCPGFALPLIFKFLAERSRYSGSGGEIFLDSGYQSTPFAVVRRYEETYSPEEFRNNVPDRQEVR